MSIYRNMVWFSKGIREYTKAGYESAARRFNAQDLNVDMSNRAVMVTGSNSGIGKVCALEVAKRGATVYMVCRSKERGEAAQKEIIDQSKNQVINSSMFEYMINFRVFCIESAFVYSGLVAA